MDRCCPNSSCLSDANGLNPTKDGFFRRASDSRLIQRFKCKICQKKFSSATFQKTYRQKKTRINKMLNDYLSSNVSQRRCAILLNVSRKTIERRFRFLGFHKKEEHFKFINTLSDIKVVQLDELQTIEHSKCKPLSVPVVVDPRTRKILCFDVASMPATGHLAKISRKKYGKRKDERQKALTRVLKKLQPILDEDVEFITDECPFYPKLIKKYFPKATHTTVKGSKSSVAGQGELKKIKYDPIFNINHTLAMLRGNINRLIRKTWCTTKNPERLLDHLYIYVNFHNKVLTA